MDHKIRSLVGVLVMKKLINGVIVGNSSQIHIRIKRLMMKWVRSQARRMIPFMVNGVQGLLPALINIS